MVDGNFLSFSVKASVLILRDLLVNMFALKSFCFYLFLIFVVVPQVVSSAQMNKSTSDGKVFITGDHNEVVVSTAQDTKIALAEIKKNYSRCRRVWQLWKTKVLG